MQRPTALLNVAHRQLLLLVVLDLLVEEAWNGDVAIFRSPRQLFSGKEQIPPEASGLSTNDVDGPVHVPDRKPVEREADVEPHFRDEPDEKIHSLVFLTPFLPFILYLYCAS